MSGSKLEGARAVHDDHDAIDRHVSVAFLRYERALVTRIPTLAEPWVSDVDLALRRLRCFVETLAGYAAGATVAAVARAVRRGFGPEVRARVEAALGGIVTGGARAAAVDELVPPMRFLRDPARPLLDAAGAQLHGRLCRAIPEVRGHLAAVHAEVARAAPAMLAAFADVLRREAADDAAALAFDELLTEGWQHYTAAVSGHRFVRPPEAPHALWRAWTQRLAGRAAPPAPTREDVVAQGYLMQIA